ncbi:putative F-box protein At1g47790 [Bidens hawaiensis]|uniref:putative F-box protein At1g47790 n=1 Tax=Bidens hawaiensis TaxID=980011 RepID=UPI00404A9295
MNDCISLVKSQTRSSPDSLSNPFSDSDPFRNHGLSRISDPSFTKLHLTHATTSLFIPTTNSHTGKLFFLSATGSSLALTHLMTLGNMRYNHVNRTEHLNGLIFITTECGHCLNDYQAIVVNPSTRKIFELPYRNQLCKFFFGFDESRYEHKILKMLGVESSSTIEVMVLSLSDYTWRKTYVSIDIGPNRYPDDITSVCLNSVVHWLLLRTFELLAFDLRTNKVSVVKLPLDDMHYSLMSNDQSLIKINGCIGVVCSHRVAETNEIDIWILQDYENRVWVKATVILPWPCGATRPSIPFDSLSMGEIIFSVRKGANVISVPVYNMKTGRFRSIEFTDLDHLFQFLPSICFYQIKCYLESIMPLLVT